MYTVWRKQEILLKNEKKMFKCYKDLKLICMQLCIIIDSRFIIAVSCDFGVFKLPQITS